MKVSDAMVLGMSMFNLEPRRWNCPDGGCLLGVAALADGVVFSHDTIFPILMHWPWLADHVTAPDICTDFLKGNIVSAERIISELAYKVKEQGLELEKVIEWVKSVEPEEQDSATHVQEIVAETVNV